MYICDIVLSQNGQKKVKLEAPVTVNRLCVYRWAYQALDMELDHPLLPLVWQNFFLRYLARPVPEQGSVPLLIHLQTKHVMFILFIDTTAVPIYVLSTAIRNSCIARAVT